MELEQRQAVFARRISNKAMQGFTVLDRDDTRLVAVMEKAADKQSIPDLVHVLLVIFTCFIWALVWLYQKNSAKGAQRVRISVDALGNVLEERAG